MTLRTQINAYILVGDSLADRPVPDGVAQGTIFHIAGGGATYILVIDVANVHTWELITGGVGSQGPGLLKWAGAVDLSNASPEYIADDPDGTSSLIPIAYPVHGGGTIRRFSVDVTAMTPSSAALIELVLNGTTVSVIGVSGTGVTTAPLAVPVPLNSTLDVRAVTTQGGGTPAITFSASLEMTNP